MSTISSSNVGFFSLSRRIAALNVGTKRIRIGAEITSISFHRIKKEIENGRTISAPSPLGTKGWDTRRPDPRSTEIHKETVRGSSGACPTTLFPRNGEGKSPTSCVYTSKRKELMSHSYGDFFLFPFFLY